MMWVGLAFLVVAGGLFVAVMRLALAEDRMLAADDAERGPAPHPTGGRHRARR